MSTNEKRWFEKYQPLIGNIIILLGIGWAIIEMKVYYEYQKNFNTFKILNSYVHDAKPRQDLIKYKNWRTYFQTNTPIPKSEFYDLFDEKSATDEKSSIIFCITKLLNYYSALEFAGSKNLMHEELHKEMLHSISADYDVLNNFHDVLSEKYKKQ